jgi:hypothetical protein
MLEYCVDSRHLAAHRATTSSSGVTFKFRLFLGSPSYLTLGSLFSTQLDDARFFREYGNTEIKASFMNAEV